MAVGFFPVRPDRAVVNDQHGTVAHVTTDDRTDWQMALRNLRNLADDDSVPTPADRVVVVVSGPAVRFLLSAAPDADVVTRITGTGVTVVACENSLSRFGHDPSDLADGVGTVPSGVAEAVRLQQGGENYLKLP